ncbi:MAG TPA: serine/threonine-protein kinase [Pyrinomonadaceae bacterium]|jgi:serine/threonine protein kinase|nr:serine/threonine-protein kinase [Pyrinomonadaceae bacterium]
MLAPNTTLQGRYRVVRQLGRGGMGTVYEARALRLNATVALKETHFTEERLRRQFEREAQLLANLRHPALPRVIDHFDESDGLYLVMDFVEGDDLWEMLKKRGAPFPAADVLKWAGQLLDALEYLHTQQPPVIHRDIKPQNIKLGEDGRLILLDFGLAKGMSDAAQSMMSSRTVMGFSLPYAPLEQILQLDEGSREQLSVLNLAEAERVRRSGTDRRSDLYSAGATLLHLLTARVPVTSPTRAISLWSGRADPLEDALAQGIPESLRAFIRRSMTLDPEQRFASASEMRDALRDASEGGAVLMPTVLDSPSGLKTRPSNDSRQTAPTPTPTTAPPDSSTRLAPGVEDSRRSGKGRRGFVAAGVIIAAVLTAAVTAAIYLSGGRASDVNANLDANTNPAAQQPPTPAPQPSVALTPEASVSPTPEVSGQPANHAPDANARNAHVNPTPHPSTTPTPRTVAQPTPQPTRDETADAGLDESAGVKDIDKRIRQLQRRKAALLRTRGPGSPEVLRIDKMLINLYIKRSLKEPSR